MSKVFPQNDPEGLLEYSVVFNDRSLNHMSAAFQTIMRSLASTLKQVYHADSVAIVPGGGTFGMEAVARQLATGKSCLVLRHGWFSYRWTQIFEMGAIPARHLVLKARPQSPGAAAPYAPPAIAEVVACIAAERPDLVFAPHVETASGIMLPEAYLRAVADAVHRVGGLFVLDCIASGTLWVDMAATGVDILISAPQKGWSASPGCAMILFSAAGRQRLEGSRSTSFAGDLQKWRQIMAAYEAGGHAYHATLPTDSLAVLHRAMLAMHARGFAAVQSAQQELGAQVRAMLSELGYASVAAAAFAAPTVVVCYTDDEGVHKGSAFAKLGLQTAAGVPLMCDEGPEFKTFRIGLFGLDKVADIAGTVARLREALRLLPAPGSTGQ